MVVCMELGQRCPRKTLHVQATSSQFAFPSPPAAIAKTRKFLASAAFLMRCSTGLRQYAVSQQEPATGHFKEARPQAGKVVSHTFLSTHPPYSAQVSGGWGLDPGLHLLRECFTSVEAVVRHLPDILPTFSPTPL